MDRVLLTLSVLALLTAGCGRTPLNGTAGDITGDGGPPHDAIILPDGHHPDAPIDAYVPDGPIGWDVLPPFDGPRPDGGRPDGGRQDGGRDGGRDGGQDAPVPFDARQSDAQHDAGGQADGSTPGVIDCGNTTCNAATQECCVTFSGASCIAKGATCQGAVATCDGPEDCPTGQICCGRSWGSNRGLSCTNPSSCSNGEIVCHLDSDCASGQRCCGESTIAGMTVVICQATGDCPNIYPTPGVPCGGSTCYSPQVCCVGTSSSCTSASGCTSGLPVRCDGPEDCSGGTPVCCGQLSSGTSCVATGSCSSGMSGGVVCHTSADCPSGQTCTDVPYAGLRVCF